MCFDFVEINLNKAAMVNKARACSFLNDNNNNNNNSTKTYFCFSTTINYKIKKIEYAQLH